MLLPGVLRFDTGIEANSELVIVSTKGEAVALGMLKKSKVMRVTKRDNIVYHTIR